jgi:hypothetical protein
MIPISLIGEEKHQMKRYSWTILAFSVFLLFTISACGLLAAPTTGNQVDPIYTQAAQTVQAQLTQQAFSTLVAQLTQAASGTLATATLAPGSPTATATQVPPTATTQPPTATSVPPTPTATPIPCNLARFVSDVTVSDGTVFVPNAEFTKIWRLKNVGSCTWNSSYDLIFVDGHDMDADHVIPLPGNVRPGETVDLVVDMTAPSKEGRHRGYWMLRSPEGSVFGIGDEGEKAFWVEIRVVAPTSSRFAYDLAANFCTANWRSSAGRLPCPSSSSDPDGSVVLLDRPTLENGRHENELALWTRPEVTNGGWITGVYPAYKVKAGDRFLADIGCLNDSQGCDVTFYLNIRLADGRERTLGSWDEVYDGKITRVDINLSEFQGESIQLILGVTANSRPSRANAFWLVPSVRSSETGDAG